MMMTWKLSSPVLIVEDEPINVSIFSKILIRLGGLKVKHIEDVETVIKMAQSGEINLILMDVCLTNSIGNGIKITQMLKADPKTAKVIVILITTLEDREALLPITNPQQFMDQVFSVMA